MKHILVFVVEDPEGELDSNDPLVVTMSMIEFHALLRVISREVASGNTTDEEDESLGIRRQNNTGGLSTEDKSIREADGTRIGWRPDDGDVN